MANAREMKELVIGKKYDDFIGHEDSPAFTIEPCVGGMVSGAQTKWRIRYSVSKEGDKTLVVMSGVPFMVVDKKYIIQYSEKGKVGELFKGYTIKLLKGYAIYSLS